MERLTENNPRLVPPSLSFMLPGLGQLYQRRYVPAALFFATFTALNVASAIWGRWVSPLVMLLAVWEAYLSAQRRESLPVSSRPRTFAFAATGILAFVMWMTFVGSAWLPLQIENAVQHQRRVERLISLMYGYRDAHGQFPARLEELGAAPLDGWDHPWRYRSVPGGVELLSCGPDGACGTSDDLPLPLH